MVSKHEEDHHIRYITELMDAKNMAGIGANIVHELWRIANAQEEIVAMAKADLEKQIEEAVESRAQDKARELEADRSKRSFIGKK